MKQTKPTKTPILFGREPDISLLLQRTKTCGITVLAARPMMGKTETFRALIRRLQAEKSVIVGYHESKGAESSHLLYAVSNLYANWLADSTFREQALSQWQRHKKGLLPKVGQAVGGLFEQLAAFTKVVPLVPTEIGSLVRKSFDGLASAQADLEKGGLYLPVLDYEQARDLTNLVAKVSGKKVILVLDAWEKSQSVRVEHKILEAFVNHLEDWPSCHIFLGIRQPEVARGEKEDEAFQWALDLKKRSAEVLIHRLPEMNLDEAENAALMNVLRAEIPALKGLDDGTVLKQIAGFPGVLNRWLSPANRETMQGLEDLKNKAHDAQDYRYREFDTLFPALSGPERVFCARLAFLPRLDDRAWTAFKSLLLGTADESLLDELSSRGVLSFESDAPTYGHDTRHTAASRWFIQHHRPLVKREGTDIVWALAKTIDRVSEEGRVVITALAHFLTFANIFQMDPITRVLIDCGRSLLGENDQNLREGFKADCLASVRKEKTTVHLIADALLNRGSTKGVLGDMDEAIVDYDTVINLSGATTEHIAGALFNRGVTKGNLGDTAGAISDYDVVINLPGASTEHVAQALNNRGARKGVLGDTLGAISDSNAVINLPGAPPEQIARALNNRGYGKSILRDTKGALIDLNEALKMFCTLNMVEGQKAAEDDIARLKNKEE